jgi:hypothetical protein
MIQTSDTSRTFREVEHVKVAESKRDLGKRARRTVCDNLSVAAHKSLILNGEMSEWLKEHAWKAKRASNTERL